MALHQVNWYLKHHTNAWVSCDASHTLTVQPVCRISALLLPKQGLADLVDRKAYSFEGPNGDSVVEAPVPPSMADDVEIYRSRLVEAVRPDATEFTEQGYVPRHCTLTALDQRKRHSCDFYASPRSEFVQRLWVFVMLVMLPAK